MAIESKVGLSRHLAGTARQPIEPALPPAEAKTEVFDAYDKAIEKVDECEAAIKQQIYSTIPDSILNRIKEKTTAKEVWTALCDLAEKWGKMVEIDVRRRIHDTRCIEGGDVRAHLDSLLGLQNQLTGMGCALSDDDFVAVILSLLPKSPHGTLQHITQEYDRRSIQTRLEKKALSDETALYSQGGSTTLLLTASDPVEGRKDSGRQARIDRVNTRKLAMQARET